MVSARDVKQVFFREIINRQHVVIIESSRHNQKVFANKTNDGKNS